MLQGQRGTCVRDCDATGPDNLLDALIQGGKLLAASEVRNEFVPKPFVM